MTLSDARAGWVYWGDLKMWALTARQRRALQFGRLTPREARELYDLRVLEGRAFWRDVERGGTAFPAGEAGR